ncbi:syntaxin-8-like [Tachypleus tridentatus]|uniref:syntaxin-8-like n=1 Tax=Tachypleus tridentatus TaxID=6853 RepID=UPI003FD335CB
MATGKGDTWLKACDACEDLSREIMELIMKRNQFQRNTSGYAQLNAQARLSIQQFNRDLITLKEDLKKSSSSYFVTQREVERRQRLLEKLESKQRQMELIFSEQTTGYGEGRTALLGGQFNQTLEIACGTEETEETKDLTVDDIRQYQQQAIKEQDEGLEGLSNIIARQKHMAYHIGNELDLHNEIIEDITDHSDVTRERLIKETRHVTTVDRKSNTCCYWVFIVILLIQLL